MTPGPKVVIGVPLYNGAEHLAEALESLLSQSYRDFDLVMVDDCSDDETEEAIGTPEPALAGRVDEGEDGEDEAPTAKRELTIPDDPTVLSYLLSGIVQVELPRRQALLEAETTVERLEGLIALLEREVVLLGLRLRAFTPDPRTLGGAARS